MKVRQGFVSNSSSSSFCIYGVDLEDYGISFGEDSIEMARALKKAFPEKWDKWVEFQKEWLLEEGSENEYLALKNIDTEDFSKNDAVKKRQCSCDVDESTKFCSKCGKTMWEEAKRLDEDAIIDIINASMYEAEFPFELHDSYIGFCYTQASDDITFGEWRENASKVLSDLFGKKVEAKHIEGTQYC